MRVWVLMNYNYEDTWLVGIFDTLKGAEVRKRDLEKQDKARKKRGYGTYGNLEIEEKEVE